MPRYESPRPTPARCPPPFLAAALLAALAACSTSAPPPPSEPALPTAAPQAAALQEYQLNDAPASRGELKSQVAESLSKREPNARQDLAPATLATDAMAAAPAGKAATWMPAPPAIEEREQYAHRERGAVLRAAEAPVSTFSVDVDTASYANVRRFLEHGRLPPADAVRVEEMINAFDYGYAPPRGQKPDTPFAAHTELAPAPWNPRKVLLRVGLQGWTPERLPASNLVFLVDVSGSMMSPDKLPLLKSALKLLTAKLRPEDRLSLAVYAGTEGVVLPPTRGDQTAQIDAAIDGLSAGGSTNGGAGIRLAYSLAKQSFIKGGVNRILLCTDGDFNVGTTDFEQLKNLVDRERASGGALSTLGFGTGNYNDRLMEQLADAGDGNYSYIDSLSEAEKVLVRNRAGTLGTIAKDVKIQVEFNPATVAENRLVGYEDRALKREDFNNDQVDAGEIGAGHSVTALYELSLTGATGARIDPLRYGGPDPAAAASRPAENAELAFLRLRYKAPDGGASKLIEQPIRRSEILPSLAQASAATRWAVAVAAFGQKLDGGRHLEGFGYDAIASLASGARAEDAQGDRAAMLKLLALAKALTPTSVAAHDAPATGGLD